MATQKKPTWVLLQYGSVELLDKCMTDRHARRLFYPSVGQMQPGQTVDVQITVENSNVTFPMKAMVDRVQERPESDKPRGVNLQIIEEDKKRFERVCAFVDGMWRPTARRAATRYPAEYKVSYQVAKGWHNGHTIDISTRGMYLRTDGPLAENKQIIKIKLALGRLWSNMELDCEVRWVDTVDGRRGMGLMCTGPQQNLEKLTELIRKLVHDTRPS